MDAEWDGQKAESNLKKRGRLCRCGSVLHDELAETVPDDSAGEERFVTIGMDAFGRLLVVVYTWRGETPRIISAREATARERREYEGNA